MGYSNTLIVGLSFGLNVLVSLIAWLSTFEMVLDWFCWFWDFDWQIGAKCEIHYLRNLEPFKGSFVNRPLTSEQAQCSREVAFSFVFFFCFFLLFLIGRPTFV